MRIEPFLRRLPGMASLVLGGWIWWYTASFPELDGGHPGPGLFPRLIGVGLALCGIALLLRPGSDDATTGHGPGWSGRLRFAVGLALVVAFPWLHAGIGFVPATALLSLAIGLMMDARWMLAVAISVAASGATYLLFTRLLGVPL